jgi:hypothetical protein
MLSGIPVTNLETRKGQLMARTPQVQTRGDNWTAAVGPDASTTVLRA